MYLAKSNERLEKASRDYSDALIENVLTYDGTIGKHHINVIAGQTYEEENTDLLTGWGLNYTEPYFYNFKMVRTPTQAVMSINMPSCLTSVV